MKKRNPWSLSTLEKFQKAYLHMIAMLQTNHCTNECFSIKRKYFKKDQEGVDSFNASSFPQSEGSSAVFPKPEQELEVEFAEQFTKLQGKFVFCLNHQELAFQFNSLVKKQGWKKIYCKDENLAGVIDAQVSEYLTNDLAGCDISVYKL